MKNSNQLDVSVVIIVKNGQNTLSRSIDSSLNQSYNAIELIIVNDGSTDNTCEIISEYKEKDTRVIVVNLEKNIGRAGARNVGLDKARGKYVIFLDADDTLPQDSIKSQVEIAEDFDADIVFGRTQCFKIGTNDSAESHYTDNIICKTINDIKLEDHPTLINNNQIVGRIYRLNFLKRNKIRFNERRRSGEDLLFSFFTALLAERISMVHDKFVYNYTVGNYLGTASIEKIFDARDNLILIANYMDNNTGSMAYAFLMRKFADYCTLLGRAEKVFSDDQVGFLQYLSTLRPLARRVSTEVAGELPEWRRDILQFIRAGYSAGALRRWKNRSAYWGLWKRS